MMPQQKGRDCRRPLLSIGLLSLCSLTVGAAPSLAVISQQDAVQAIQDAKVLPADARLKVQLNKDVATVSTFHHDKDNLNDLKIDAVMIGKSIMDAPASEIVRVIVYFYNQALTDMKVVSVSAGDIKAFGAGQMAQDQLLRSINVETKSVSRDDNNSSMTSYLEAAQSSRADSKTKVMIVQDTMTVWSPIEFGMTERDCKIEGLRLAERAKAIAPANVQTIKVSFTEPGQYGHERSMSFEVNRLNAINTSVNNALEDVKLSTNSKAQRSTDLESYTPLSGQLFDDRKILLDRIKGLSKDGVGVKPFFDAFLTMEGTVATLSKDKLSESINRLSTQIDEQEKRSQAAKEFQPKSDQTKTAASTAPATSCHPAALPATAKKTVYTAPVEVDSGAMAFTPKMAEQIRSDPNGWVNYWQHRYSRDPNHKPEEYPAFIRVLDFAAKTLTDANRPQEAVVFANRAQAGRELRRKNSAAGN